jgi:hypothetical protein
LADVAPSEPTTKEVAQFVREKGIMMMPPAVASHLWRYVALFPIDASSAAIT